MRARGAQATDVAVLVVAADDGVMPTTREAMAHIRSANVPLIVAINKIDLPSAPIPDRVKQQLSEMNVVPEEWGGDVPFVEVSAREKLGLDDLLEVILLVADVNELKANPHKLASGVVIEAKVDRNRGPVATLLIQSGTLNLRDIVVAGGTWGRVKAMFDDRGKRVRRADPSMPVEILGLLEDLPGAGDPVQVFEDERTAKQIVEQRQPSAGQTLWSWIVRVKLTDLYSQIRAGSISELRVVIKADVQGSLGAIQSSLLKLNDDSQEVRVSITYAGTGAISESDVSLASATRSIIIGFNVRPDVAAKRAADSADIDIRFYNIIYNLLDEVKAAMNGMLAPIFQDVTDGYAEVRETFKLPGGDVVAGLYVLDGRITRNSRARVLRGGKVVHEGAIKSLKRFKDDVREVAAGYECGLGLDNFNDIQVRDQIEFFHRQEIART